VSLVSREIKHFRDRQAQPDKMDTKTDNRDDDDNERDKRMRLEREREIEREERRREREEREFREREKEWEARERAREREREKEKQKSKSENIREMKDLSFDDGERKKRSRDYYRGKKEREKERMEDEADKLREIQEEEYRRREQDRKREELEMQQLQQLQQMRAQIQAKMEQERLAHHQPPPPPLERHESPSQRSPDDKAGILDRSRLDKLFFATPSVEKKSVFSVVPGFDAEPEVDELFTKKKEETCYIREFITSR